MQNNASVMPATQTYGTVTSLPEYKQRKLTLRNPGRFLLDEPFSQQQASLAEAFALSSSKTIGRNASEIVLKLFGLMLSKGESTAWMSRHDWQHQTNLPWISERGIRTAIGFLVRERILTRTYDRFHGNRSVYQIALERLNDFVKVPVRWLEKEQEIEQGKQQNGCDKRSSQPDQMIQPAVTNDPTGCDKRSSSSIDPKIPNLETNLETFSEENSDFFSSTERAEGEKTMVVKTEREAELKAAAEASQSPAQTPSLVEMTEAAREKARADRELRFPSTNQKRPEPDSAGSGELKRLTRLVGADGSARSATVIDFICAAVRAGKSETEIISALNAHVFPLGNDSLKREDILPAYASLGLIGHPYTAGPAMERIGGAVANVAGQITGMSTEPCNDPAHRGPRKR